MKTYTIEVVIEEGSDEFWDEINGSGSTGCDQVKQDVSDALVNHGLTFSSIKMKRFESNEDTKKDKEVV